MFHEIGKHTLSVALGHIQSPGEIIRLNDVVKIIKPRFFLRVGYDNNIKDVCDELSQVDSISRGVNELIDKALGESNSWLNFEGHRYGHIRHKVIKALAYGVVQKRMTGAPRQIYFQECPELENLNGKVVGKRYVQTGTYYPSTGYGEDYEPGGLMNPTTHIILKVTDSWSFAREFVATDVRKLKDGEWRE